jgi:hypothetical protein
VIRSFIEDVLDQGQLGLINDLMPFSRSSRQASRGAKAFKEVIAAIRTAFPDMHPMDDGRIPGI